MEGRVGKRSWCGGREVVEVSMVREGAAMAALVQIHAVQSLRQLSCHRGANTSAALNSFLF